MPKKNAKAQKSNELDGAEFFAAINLIEKEKGIPKAYMLEKITQALVSAYKRDHEGSPTTSLWRPTRLPRPSACSSRRRSWKRSPTPPPRSPWTRPGRASPPPRPGTWSASRSNPETLAGSPPRPPAR